MSIEIQRALTVSVMRRSMFPRNVKPEMILLDGMRTGAVIDGHFVIGARGNDHVIAWHPDHIGRGIEIRWDSNDVRFTQLKLELPSMEEELEDFFLMCARLARQDISEVMLNNQPFTPKIFAKTKEEVIRANLKLLHDLMGKVLNEDTDLALSCVFAELHAGMDEADFLWAGIDASSFKDWLNQCQNPEWYYMEPWTNNKCQPLCYPAGKTVILPSFREDTIQRTVWLMDEAGQKAGEFPYALLASLPAERFDAAQWICEPIGFAGLNDLLLGNGIG